MIGFIITFAVIWALRFLPRKEFSRETQLVTAALWPFVVMAMAFLWNVWGHNLIGWPQITSFKELVIAFVVF